jgi:hypothetical protein
VDVARPPSVTVGHRRDADELDVGRRRLDQAEDQGERAGVVRVPGEVGVEVELQLPAGRW